MMLLTRGALIQPWSARRRRRWETKVAVRAAIRIRSAALATIAKWKGSFAGFETVD